jgi:PAS domain-containing protein
MKTVLLTILFGIACLKVDSTLQEVVTTPLFGLCWLIVMAMRCTWKDVAKSFIILLVFVVFSLSNSIPGRILVRTTGFLLSGGLAIAISRNRQRTLDALSTAEAIVRGAPIAMVATDMTGSIVAASEEAEKIAAPQFQNLIGQSFPDMFMAHLAPGKAMKDFFDWFQSDEVHSVDLCPRRDEQSFISARIMAAGTGTDRRLVAIISDKRSS